MRVLYLCEHPTLLGGERSLLYYLDRARGEGLHATVAAPSDGPLADALRDLRIQHHPWIGPAKNGELVDGESRLRGVEIVHANSLSLAAVARKLAERMGVPWVCHVRDVYRLSSAKIAGLSSADAIIAVSHFVRDWLLSLGLAPEKTFSIPNAISPMSPLPADAFAVPTFACIGQVCLRKGQDDFLKAAELVSAALPEARFVLVGERYSAKPESLAFEASLREQARRKPLAGKVEFAGHMDDPCQRLGEWTTVVSASRQEPLSRVLLEALSGGRVCVATDAGGTRQVLDDGRLGWLVRPGDHEELAKAMIASTVETDRRAFLSREGPNWIESEFSFQRQHASLQQVYRETLSTETGD